MPIRELKAAVIVAPLPSAVSTSARVINEQGSGRPDAAAAEKGVPLYQHLAELAGVKPPYVLPTPALNVINGGSHAGNKLAFQEFMLLPTGATSFTEAMKIGSETYHTLKKVISAKYGIDGEYARIYAAFSPRIYASVRHSGQCG